MNNDDLAKTFPMVDTTNTEENDFLNSVEAARELFRTSEMKESGKRLGLWSTPRLLKELDCRMDENKYYFTSLKVVDTKVIMRALIERVV